MRSPLPQAGRMKVLHQSRQVCADAALFAYTTGTPRHLCRMKRSSSAAGDRPGGKSPHCYEVRMMVCPDMLSTLDETTTKPAGHKVEVPRLEFPRINLEARPRFSH